MDETPKPRKSTPPPDDPPHVNEALAQAEVDNYQQSHKGHRPIRETQE